MSNLQTRTIDWTDFQHKETLAQRWNDLFTRSTARFPSSRFEHVALWYRTFAPTARKSVLIVEDGDEWVCVAPLLARRIAHLVSVWQVPYSPWSPSPEILVARDRASDRQVYESLLTRLGTMGRLWFQAIEIPETSLTTQGMVQALRRLRRTWDVAPRFEVGQVLIRGPGAAHDWSQFLTQLSGNFRRKMGKMTRRAESQGGVELVVERPTEPAEVERLMRLGFELEDRGWKGRGGTSVLRAPGMWEFFLQQAQLLAQRGELQLLFLKHQQREIAFEYGWRFGRVYYSPKVAYDEEYGHLSPGNLLTYFWIERMFSTEDFDTFDFCGPLAPATASWSTRKYPVVRVLSAATPLGDRCLSWALRTKAISQRLQSTIRSVVTNRGRGRFVIPGSASLEKGCLIDKGT